MQKPPNIRYAYSIRQQRKVVQVPDFFNSKNLLVAFNIEADRPDDLLYDKVYLNNLRLSIQETLLDAKNIGVILLVPVDLKSTFEQVFEKQLEHKSAILITTDAPH